MTVRSCTRSITGTSPNSPDATLSAMTRAEGREQADALAERGATDRVKDHVDAARRRLLNLVGPVVPGAVDAVATRV